MLLRTSESGVQAHRQVLSCMRNLCKHQWLGIGASLERIAPYHAKRSSLAPPDYKMDMYIASLMVELPKTSRGEILVQVHIC